MNKNRIRYYINNYAATPEELGMLRLDGSSDTSVYIQLLQLRGRRDEEALYCRLIHEECGKTEYDIKNELAFIRSMEPPIEISLDKYYKYGAYMLDVLHDKEALVQWISKLSRYMFVRDQIIQKIEIENMPYPAFEKELEETRVILSEILSGSRKKELIEAIKDIRPELLEDKTAFDKAAVDMELSISVLGFVPEEYVSYHFWEKTVSERLEYVSDRLRKKVGQSLNPEKGRDILNNKYLTYQALKPLYGRKIRQMNADGGYSAFEKAFREKSVLVKKNNFQSLGKEIEKIETTEATDLRTLYERITANGQYFILEDLIVQHPELNRMNPDSVNTIRIVTYMNHEEPIVLDSFVRAGRRGCFVDNGGRGGIFVHVDWTKGITDSQGIDERGFFYESHPDHGYLFFGISIPLWDEALKTAKKAAQTIPEARYVGWDLVCTDENRWIIVEGNVMTMYIGQQAPLGIGKKRREILEKIHYDELIRSE